MHNSAVRRIIAPRVSLVNPVCLRPRDALPSVRGNHLFEGLQRTRTSSGEKHVATMNSENLDEATARYRNLLLRNEHHQLEKRLKRKQRRHDKWGRPIPRWFGRALFAIWMLTFGLVWLFFIPIFIFIGGVSFFECYYWPSDAWFRPWHDATFVAVHTWIITAIAFMALMVINPAEQTARR